MQLSVKRLSHRAGGKVHQKGARVQARAQIRHSGGPAVRRRGRKSCGGYVARPCPVPEKVARLRDLLVATFPREGWEQIAFELRAAAAEELPVLSRRGHDGDPVLRKEPACLQTVV